MAEGTMERGVEVPQRIDILNGETSATGMLIIYHNHSDRGANASEQHYTAWASACNEEAYINVYGIRIPRLGTGGDGPQSDRDKMTVGQAYHALPKTSICTYCYKTAQELVARVVLKPDAESEE